VIDMNDIVSQIEYLPPLPGVPFRVLTRLQDPDVTPASLYEIIRLDPALSADVLKLCNSAAFGLARQVRSLREALVHLGSKSLRSMLLLVLAKNIYARDYRGYEEHHGALQRHSIAVALISSYLHPYYPGDSEVLFTVALLHDVGKVVLSEYAQAAMAEIVRLTREENLTFDDAEVRVLGMTHAEVGAMVLEHWKCDPEMVEAIRFHHTPERAPDSPLTHFVALADIMAMLVGLGTEVDGLRYRAFPGLCKRYGIREKDVERVLSQALVEFRKFEEIVS